MALIVEDGTGIQDAESYISVADTDTRFSTQRADPATYSSADWNDPSVTDEVKEACLRFATELIDEHLSFNGTKVNAGDRYLQWPRSGVIDRDGNEIDSDYIPKKIKNACAEMARALLVDATIVDNQEVGLSSLGVGSINLVFDKFDRAGVLPDTVTIMLSDFGTSRYGSGVREVVRT